MIPVPALLAVGFPVEDHPAVAGSIPRPALAVDALVPLAGDVPAPLSGEAAPLAVLSAGDVPPLEEDARVALLVAVVPAVPLGAAEAAAEDDYC